MQYNISYLFRAIDKLSPVVEKIKNNINSLSPAIKKSDSSINRASRNITASFLRIDRKLIRLQGRFKDFGNNIRNTGKSISNFGRAGLLKLTLPFGSLIGMIVKTRAEMENTEIMFETMLGNADKSAKLIAEIRAMAVKTPFGEKELFNSSKLLLNFGVNAKKVIPYMTMLGNIAGGNKQRFQQLSLAFAQSSAQGRLTGQDLLQMVNAGFNPLQIISEKTGRSMGDLKDIMSKGGISFEMVAKAMQQATGEGGKFFNLMEKGSKTAGGRFSTLLDNIRIEFEKLGKQFEPITKGIIEKLIILTEKFGKLSPQTKKWIVIIGGLLATLPILALVIGGLTTSFGFMLTGIGTLAGGFTLLLSPVGLIIGALATLMIKSKSFRSGFITIMSSAFDWIGTRIKDFVNAMQNLISIFGKIKDFTSEKISGVKNFFSGEDKIKQEVNNNVKANYSKEMLGKLSVDINHNNVPQGTNMSVFNSNPLNFKVQNNMSMIGGY